LREAVLSKLKLCWSPEQIAGRFKRENGGKARISHESIYTYIYSGYGIRNRWHECLRRKRRWRIPRIGRKQRLQIPNRVGIVERSTEINKRQTFGHWEGDLMVFGRGTKTNLITLRERMSRYMVAVVNPSKHSEITASNIIKALRPNQECVNSITFDNGLEFSKHETIAKDLKAATYFCEPYKSYQKGSVENGNGLLRIDLPRNINSELISTSRVNHLVKRINYRPMKCLDYQTPVEIFNQCFKNIASGRRDF